MNVLVIGCGTVGVEIALLLSRAGHDVSVVDNDRTKFNNLGKNFTGIVTAGMPIDQDVLRNAGIEGCDAVVIATGSDNMNIMAAQIAKDIFHVPKVVARVIDPAREDVFSHFGLSTVCPTRMTADAFISALMDDYNGERITIGTCTIGFSLRDIDGQTGGVREIIDGLPLRKDETLIGIQKANGNVIPVSRLDREYSFEQGDRAVLTRIID